MLPQPPPDAPAPPPSEAALRSRRKWKWLCAVGIISIVLCPLGLTYPLVVKQRRKADLSQAEGNACQLHIGMVEFKEEYGKFPDATTIAAVEKATGKVVPAGTTTSNDFFRQLYVAGLAPGESIFCTVIAGTHKSDGRMDDRHFLDKGECGFTYLMGAIDGDNPKRPLVVAPMIPGTDRFDPKPFNGKAVIMPMYGGYIALPIDVDGHAILDGRNMMDPHHPIWDGHPPAIAWPDL